MNYKELIYLQQTKGLVLTTPKKYEYKKILGEKHL